MAASTTPPAKPASAASSTASKANSSGTHTATTKHASGKPTTHKSSASGARSVSAKKTPRKGQRTKSAGKRGQQVIDSARAREIQEALIREHYLEGEPSGTWDSATQAAMQRYQEDRGWQSKTTPDSRALIQLGLGPNHDHLLNPESAMTSAPADPKAEAKPAAANPNPQR